MFFSVILILLIAIVFRKQKMAEAGQQKSDEIEHLSKNKKELILGLSWYFLFYAVLHKLCLSGRYNKRIIKLAVSGFLSTPDYCCFQKRESDTNPERNRLKTF